MTDSRSAREILVDVISFTACANEGVGLDEILDRYRDEILDGQLLFHKNAELRNRAERAEADLAIAEQQLENGKMEADRAWSLVRSLLGVLRPVLNHLPTECRYHGTELNPPSGTYGREACCDTGLAALHHRNARRLVDHIETEHTSKGKKP